MEAESRADLHLLLVLVQHVTLNLEIQLGVSYVMSVRAPHRKPGSELCLELQLPAKKRQGVEEFTQR